MAGLSGTGPDAAGAQGGLFSPLARAQYAALAALLALAGVFAQAWWTTRKPSERRNLWAAGASLVTLVGGVCILWMGRARLSMSSPGLLTAALGVLGAVVYSQGGTLPGTEAASSPAPAAAAPKPARVAGDRTHPWVNHAFTALSLAAEAASVYLWSIWAHSQGLAGRGHLPWYLLFTVAVFAATVIHECGHALAAWTFQMKLLSFNAGPLKWRKHEGKWRFRFDPEGFFNLGGAVRVVPTNPEQPPSQDLWMIAAGPLANIWFGLLALWAVLWLRWPLYEQTWRLVAFTASFCFIAAITNLLPFLTSDGGYSDGARILQMLTRSPLNDYHRVMNGLAATLVTPRRKRDLDIQAIERAANAFPKDLRGLHLKLCASGVYLETGRLPEARSALLAAESIYNNNLTDLPVQLHTPFIIGQAYLLRNAARARVWWDRMEAKEPTEFNVDYWLARTALLWIEGNTRAAEEVWQKADAAAQKLPPFGAYEFDRFRCALLREELDSASGSRIARTVPRVPSSFTPIDRQVQPGPVEQGRFDPLEFIRTGPTLDKLRA